MGGSQGTGSGRHQGQPGGAKGRAQGQQPSKQQPATGGGRGSQGGKGGQGGQAGKGGQASKGGQGGQAGKGGQGSRGGKGAPAGKGHKPGTGHKGGKGAKGSNPAEELKQPLERVLSRLPATQRKVLELRMGLADGHPHDLADTARTLGLSLSEARDIEKRAFEHIREAVPLQQLQRFLQA
jgi:hypothetical protein